MGRVCGHTIRNTAPEFLTHRGKSRIAWVIACPQAGPGLAPEATRIFGRVIGHSKDGPLLGDDPVSSPAGPAGIKDGR
jgi:hypothetical protein